MKSNNSIQYQTANLTVCPASGEVRSGDNVFRLGPINMQVLITLLDRPGEVVSRSELFDNVWKNQIVSDDTLTRCISDIRGQLGGKDVVIKLIETVPKKGYRWLPEVLQHAPVRNSTDIISNSELLSEINQSTVRAANTSRTNSSGWKVGLLWLTSGLVLMLLLSTSVLWFANHLVSSKLIKVALLPTDYTQPEHQTVAAEIDENLKRSLLRTEQLRYLSPRVVGQTSVETFSFLASKFGAEWVLESQLYAQGESISLSLSLIDSTTALVIYSLSRTISNNSDDITLFCDEFVQQAARQVESH